MSEIAQQMGTGGAAAQFAYLAIAAVAVSGVALAVLHAVSPEFSPSWRMVSEYANGKHGWLLLVVFLSWAVSSFALLAALWPVWGSTLGKIGLALLLLAGIGQVMGGVFDIKHPLHGPAAMIGIPSLCVAAVVLTIAISRLNPLAAPPFWSAHLPWISFILMIGAFMLYFSALKSAGVDMSGRTEPLDALPDGVSGYVGWANRMIFLASYIWVTFAALASVKLSNS